MKVVVFHQGYGCDTGCCGHIVELEDGTERFEFTHPYGQDSRAFVEELVIETFGKEHVAGIDWENCIIVDD